MNTGKMLFIDIEWNKVTETTDLQKSEMIQMAGISCSSECQMENKFSRIVKPGHIDLVTENTYKLLHLSEKILLDAKPLEVVLDNFFQTFHNYEVLIVWNKEAYDIFVYYVNALGYKMPVHKSVILQEVIADITKEHKKKIGFKDALKWAKIQYDKNLLHCAKHDVSYLKLLFEKVSENYKKECQKEEDTECYSSKKSNILHNMECRYKEAITEQNLIKRERSEVFSGAKVCKYCIKREGFGKLAWKGKREQQSVKAKSSFEDEYIYNLCDHFDLKCQIGKGVIFVNTGITAWRIYHDEEKVTKVYHENYRAKRDERCKKKKKCNEGYHKQDIRQDTLYEVLHYIKSHDEHFFERKNTKKNRIDMLFEMVERERRGREELQV